MSSCYTSTIKYACFILDPGIEPGSPALQADSLASEPPGKPQEQGGEGGVGFEAWKWQDSTGSSVSHPELHWA